MQYVVQAVPFLVVIGIAALVLASRFRGRIAFKRPVRPARHNKSSLFVSQDQMDKDLNDLIRRR